MDGLHTGAAWTLRLTRSRPAKPIEARYGGQRRDTVMPDAVHRWLSTGGGPVAAPWLSADDIAAHLGVTKDTVYAWIAEKGMPAHKLGRLWKFQASEVDAWVRGGGAARAVQRRKAQ